MFYTISYVYRKSLIINNELHFKKCYQKQSHLYKKNHRVYTKIARTLKENLVFIFKLIICNIFLNFEIFKRVFY